MKFKEWVSDKKDEIQIFFKDWFYYKPRRLYRYFRALPKIIQITWQTNNPSDYASIVEVLMWKTKEVRDHIQEHRAFEGFEDRVKEMDEFLGLLAIGYGTIDPPEVIKAQGLHDELLGSFAYDSVPNGDTTFTMVRVYEKNLNEKEKELEWQDLKAIGELERNIRDAHWKKAFELFGRKITGWWC